MKIVIRKKSNASYSSNDIEEYRYKKTMALSTLVLLFNYRYKAIRERRACWTALLMLAVKLKVLVHSIPILLVNARD